MILSSVLDSQQGTNFLVLIDGHVYMYMTLVLMMKVYALECCVIF